MKQVFLRGGQAHLCDVPLPEVAENGIFVKVAYSFISSGTEGAILKASSHSLFSRFVADARRYTSKVQESINQNGLSGTYALIKEKSAQFYGCGYSCSGSVVKVGAKVSSFKVGDLVACAGAGIANHAEFVAVPTNLAVKIAHESLLEAASITTIGAIALQGLRRSGACLGEVVCVVGLGLLGLLTVQLARVAGCRVIGIDTRKDRLDLGLKFGCEAVYEGEAACLKDIAFRTGWHGVDATILTAASKEGSLIDTAMQITRRKGKVVLVGDIKPDFARDVFYEKEIDFLISTSYGPGRYDASYEIEGHDYPYSYVRWTENRNMQCFARFLEDGVISIHDLATKIYNVQDAAFAFKDLESGRHLGIMLRYNSLEKVYEKPLLKRVEAKAYCAPTTKKLSTALVGAGGFAKVKLVPILLSNKGVLVDYVVDPEPTRGLNMQGLGSLVGFDDVVKSNVNMVVLASPHANHAMQSRALLEAGKSVFAEKPAAISLQEWRELAPLCASPHSLYAVDFNRSFAPFIRTIKSDIEHRTTPLVVNYRMNAGYITLNHWTQSAKHGGRIIGEACHIFDLFCYLTDAEPAAISVEALRPQKEGVLSSDNVSVHIRFSDGSLCVLVYTALGSSALSKERMELFFDGKSIVMDDYETLRYFGFSKKADKTARFADKGHAFLLNQFIEAALNGGSSPIPFQRIDYATRISFIADELAHQGGGVAFFEKDLFCDETKKVTNNHGSRPNYRTTQT